MVVNRIVNDQLAILSHFLHNREYNYCQSQKQQIIDAAREYICQKEDKAIYTMTDDDLWRTLNELNFK